jgi:serine/threonine-protein kinase RsbT
MGSTSEFLPIRTPEDVVRVRTVVRKVAVELKFGLVDQTKLVTAASEIARNTLAYGLGGDVRLDVLEEGNKRGLRLIFQDQGPGIADVAMAMRDGYTSGKGMGLGLGGSQRLVDEFQIASEKNKGTTVTIAKWTR